MASGEMAQLLEEREGVVQLRPTGEIVRLKGLSGEDASQLLESGWERAHFMGGYDQEMQEFYAKLTLGKPLVTMNLDPVFGRLPDDIRDKANKQLGDNVSGDVSDDGSSLLPTLLARAEHDDGDIDLIVCTAGTSWEDYLRDNPSAGVGNERYDSEKPLISTMEIAAIQGLRQALAEASGDLLARQIR